MNENRPDPARLGGLEWTRRTGGNLSRRERTRLLGAIAVSQWDNLLGRTKLVLGRLPKGADAVDLSSFVPPDTKFAREAELACDELPAQVIGHSYRTWFLGNALASVDGVKLDAELFYAGSLLHDHGIASITPGQDFTVRSAERALEAAWTSGVPSDRADLLADGICAHLTPGVKVKRDGQLAAYIQWGAMVDGAGLRSWDVAPAVLEEVVRRHPRDGFKSDLIAMVRAEADAVPSGRFGLLRRCGMAMAIRMAPFPS